MHPSERLENFLRLLEDIENNINMPNGDKVRLVFNLFSDILETYTSNYKLVFTTLFAKISFIGLENKFPADHSYLIQNFRRLIERGEVNSDNESEVLTLGIFVCKYLLFHKMELRDAFNDLIKTKFEEQRKYLPKKKEYREFKHLIEGLVVAFDKERKIFMIEIEDSVEKFIVKYNILNKNEIFTSSLEKAFNILSLPIPINLIEVDVNHEGNFEPRAFVILPDYLLDVSTIASTKADSNGEYWLYALKKFHQSPVSKEIMVGNLANIMLDEIIHNPNIKIEELFPKFFKENAIFWTSLSDDEVKETIDKLKLHFQNLRKAIEIDFKNYNINKDNIYLEPSFYCRDYGIQGRLDLLHIDESNQAVDIIELKSGKKYKTNTYGINEDHYHQTLLYDMMIKSTSIRKENEKCFILYSSANELQLNYAPPTKEIQLELIKRRNDIAIIDHGLTDIERSARIIKYLKSNNFPDISGFSARDLNQFEELYSTLLPYEKDYYNIFVSFIQRENIQAKIGEAGNDKSNGLSSLWLEREEIKKQRFAILSFLQIIENNSDKPLPTIKFQFYEGDDVTLSNFRVGDICVIYPRPFEGNPRLIINAQIFKGSIEDIDDKYITIKLRSQQKNQEVFRKTDYWSIEADVLDSSFRHMHSNLFMFINAPSERRHLILGQRSPERFKIEAYFDLPDSLSNEQKNIILSLFYTKEYSLVWGPPGTGKTNVIIKHLTNLMLKYTDERILILAYTNRAVDEICEALIEQGLSDQIIRIGSKSSISESQKNLLLNEKIKDNNKRFEILETLKSCRIYCSTLSSFIGKPELLNLINFDLCIIDEASQIIEPMLCGILTVVKRFVLIGDFKQLPAVVAQDEKYSKIENRELNKLGFYDTRMSLFERLYQQAKNKNWIHAIYTLSQQGRMHMDILNFVNEHFYDNSLKNLNGINRLIEPLRRGEIQNVHPILLQKRVIFIETKKESFNQKINKSEAIAIVEVIKNLITIYKKMDFEIHKDSIGVITPFRAQISTIKSELNRSGISEHIINKLTIDTVERYQGGAKDIILLSTCVNNEYKLQTIVSKAIQSIDANGNEIRGIDRKLNVAITRTKEQFILFGNRDILIKEESYKNLIQYSACIDAGEL